MISNSHGARSLAQLARREDIPDATSSASLLDFIAPAIPEAICRGSAAWAGRREPFLNRANLLLTWPEQQDSSASSTRHNPRNDTEVQPLAGHQI
jgi:hypothetical protein